MSGRENRRWLTKQATVQMISNWAGEERGRREEKDEKRGRGRRKEKRKRKGGRIKREPGLAYCRDVDYIW